MKDHNDYLPGTLEVIDLDLKRLKEFGDSDSQLNYLYYLRDAINGKIKQAKKDHK